MFYSLLPILYFFFIFLSIIFFFFFFSPHSALSLSYFPSLSSFFLPFLFTSFYDITILNEQNIPTSFSINNDNQKHNFRNKKIKSLETKWIKNLRTHKKKQIIKIPISKRLLWGGGKNASRSLIKKSDKMEAEWKIKIHKEQKKRRVYRF